ncbi:hypothetical protein [Actinotalea sp.]|uniref:hypothetical protein n=1 Tax=Actinotalea sp. TaxID=1872145 RepID=UPI002C1B05B2|nr:hypothetical protein [Actinotalea sp.]HQY34554.1 hypothetical protein [Actinotalea sp.]HRA49403.1 hypothetical protein [Actinotalea sp.]
MGRHAAPPPEDAGQTRGAPTDPAPTARTWWEHAVLATVAALAVGGVMAWAGGPSWAAALGGLASAVVVLAAGWLAGRLPRHGAGPG